jgi:2-amino-4-hydroxy-6-hydroxymethyldihydropteridine diphosphokinase
MIEVINEQVYLSTGSNLGDRFNNLLLVVENLPPKVQVIGKSSIYETEPWDYLEQPKFLNQVLCVQTELSPLELLVYVKDLEKKIGRKPGVRYGPREVDIDILIFEEQLVEKDILTIPHKRLKERAFVLVPLAELAPELILPEHSETIEDLLQFVDSSGVTLYVE